MSIRYYIHIKYNYKYYKQLILNYSLPNSSLIKYINFPNYFNLKVFNSSIISSDLNNIPHSKDLDANIQQNLKNFTRKKKDNKDSGINFLALSVDNAIVLNQKINSKQLAFFGTLHSFINQMINKNFKKTLILNGVGYKIEIKSYTSSTCNTEQKYLNIFLGFSHPVVIPIPFNIFCNLINSNTLELESYSLQDLTQFVNSVVQIKPGYKDKYKEKGFKSL